MNDDREILRILERDARISVEKLAAMTGLSAERVRTTIQAAEADGRIRAYRARIDWERSGDARVFAFIDLAVQPQRDLGYDPIAEHIYRFPEVHSVYLVSGSQDLRVVLEGKTIQEVASFVAEKLAPIEGVRGTTTNFLLKKYKDDGVIFHEPSSDRRLAVTP